MAQLTPPHHSKDSLRQCPRCRSTMVLSVSDTYEAWQPMWKCLGCGREIIRDESRQAEDEKLLERIRGEQRTATQRTRNQTRVPCSENAH
ncbi:MAG: hypothetical protein NVSMB52_05380 [Chloroflexota bacterium]